LLVSERIPSNKVTRYNIQKRKLFLVTLKTKLRKVDEDLRLCITLNGKVYELTVGHGKSLMIIWLSSNSDLISRLYEQQN
jgi:hypothetical protein